MNTPTHTPADVARACSIIEAAERQGALGVPISAAVILLDEHRSRQADTLPEPDDCPPNGIKRPAPPNDTLGSFRAVLWLLPTWATLAGVIWIAVSL